MKEGIVLLLILALLPAVYAVQINSSTEIYWFNVTNCAANVSSVGCAPAWIHFNCSISNYAYIDYVQFEINDTYHNAQQTNDHFYYDLYKSTTTVDTNGVIDWQKVSIHDVGAGVANFDPNIQIDHICDACEFNITYGACNTSDLRMVQYVGDGSPNCTSFNASEPCDYCTPSWSITSDCNLNNTEYREYSDANSCYAVTSLYSDSCDYSFTDCDQWVSCSFLGEDFQCGYDTNPLIEIAGNRIFWECSLDNASTDYQCISYVKEQGFTIQTNPQVRTFSTGIFSKEQETREFFTASNGLVNPYFTTDNLKHNMTYIFGVKCSSDNGQLSAEHYVTPMYQNLDEVAYRSVWLKDNAGYLIGGLILFVVVILILMMVVRR